MVRAVDRRAGELMGEYRRKADRMDALLGDEGGGRVRPYLIFVIFFTQAKLLENKIYTEKMHK